MSMHAWPNGNQKIITPAELRACIVAHIPGNLFLGAHGKLYLFDKIIISFYEFIMKNRTKKLNREHVLSFLKES